jgi:hypothetical protein
VLVVSLVVFVVQIVSSAQERFEAGGQLSIVRSDAFDKQDTGFGGRLSWYPIDWIGAEAELNFYPQDFGAVVPFSRSRVEGLFGVTVGPRLAGIRPFAQLRPGFVTFRGAGQPTVCILIFPPPLTCTLAAGRTMFALDLGGGVDLDLGTRAFVRIDAGDRLIKYPGPVLLNGQARQESFYSHDFRFSTGAGVRF